MRVRFKLAWQTYRVGDIIEPPGMLRDWLIRNGYVEPAKEEAPPAPPRRRGRPPKKLHAGASSVSRETAAVEPCTEIANT